jgi:glycosyltransferase involved in cell wall biosynthesis
MNMMPEISVLMSVYNGEAFLKQAVDSILLQTFKDFELIIINDGSTDQTRKILEFYTDRRIRLYHVENNQGVGAALHFGLSKAVGKYIAKADADDIHYPTRLQKQKEYLDCHPDMALVKTFINYFPHNQVTRESSRYKHSKFFRENFKNCVITSEDLAEKIYWTCCIPHTTIMARSEAMLDVNYDPSLRIAEDYKLFYELNKKGYKMSTIEEVLVDMRISMNSTTVQMDSELWKVVFQIKEKEIRRMFDSGDRFFLWGAGGKGIGLIEKVFPQDLVIDGFIDSDPMKQNKQLIGYPVYSPDVLTKGDKVLIASEPGLYSIGEELKNKGYKPLEDFIGFF